MKIAFTSEVPHDPCLWALGVYGNESNSALPPMAVETMQRKPHELVVDLFVKQNTSPCRYVIARLEHKTDRRKREETGAALYKKIAEGTEKELVLDIRNLGLTGLDLLIGILLNCWRFNKYRTVFNPGQKQTLEQITILCHEPDAMEKYFNRHQAVIEGVLFARTLTSEPPNILYPMIYAERLKELEQLGVGVEILDEQALKQIGMEALLAVGKGSQHQSAVAIMTWNGHKHSTQPIVVVGKGVCFDSGGLCLKKPQSLLEMKWDKSGAGVVAGLMKALSLQKAPVYVVGIVGLVENMPDGEASRPGDIIKTMSGQTVEIADTDAEGRLVLADCLWYGRKRFNPSVLIDLGTLTIETIACLGNQYGGLYSTCPKLAEGLKAAGKISGEEVWELPMGEFFAKQIESPVADIKNVGLELCGENGASAEFLKRFVGEVPWAHIDIAGVSWTKDDLPLAYKGVTGFGVRLLEEWIRSYAGILDP